MNAHVFFALAAFCLVLAMALIVVGVTAASLAETWLFLVAAVVLLLIAFLNIFFQRTQMNIGLDYDGTFTNDPELWLNFVTTAKLKGHNVFIVTMRYPSECIGQDPSSDAKNGIDQRLLMGTQLIATSRLAKRPACEALGITIHVWIDDHPQAVDKDAVDIWGPLAPEGSPVVVKYD